MLFFFLVRDWVIQCETVMVVWVRKLLLNDFLFERAISGQFCFTIEFNATVGQGIGLYAQILSEQACSSQLDLHWGSVFASRLRTRVFSVQSFPL